MAAAADATAPAAASNPLAKENWPTSAVDRPLALSGGMLQIDVPVWVNLSKGAAAKPINVPLAVWYGVSDQLQLGLVHGQYLGWGAGNGLCLTGKSGGCGKAYDNIGVNGLYSLTGRGGNLELAVWGQLNVASFDPMFMQLEVGGAMNLVVAGNIAILAYPGLNIGLTKRDLGNKESIFIPVYAYFRAHANLAPFVTLGLGGPLDGFGDAVGVPVGLGALYAVNAMIDIGARFDIGSLVTHAPAAMAGAAAGSKPGVFDAKTMAVWVSIRPL